MIDSIITELQSLLANVKNMQSRYLGEVLSLQKIINYTHKAIPYIPNKDNNKQLQTQQKRDKIEICVQQKVNALMKDIELRQKNIESYQTDQKVNKFQLKQAEVVIQKKPPIPTGNRNQKALKNQIPLYVPPKSKNQVTGKVTQTVMRTSAQKIFKPEKTSSKKIQNKQQVKNKNNERERSAQKKIQKKQTKFQHIDIKPESVKNQIKPQLKRQSTSFPIKQAQKKEVVHKEHRVKLATFQKCLEQMVCMMGDGQKTHKKQLQRLLSDCQTEQKGHRMHEDNNRRIFIKRSNNYSTSRHAVYPMSSFQINRKKWSYHPKFQHFHLLLDSLINQLQNLQFQKDCRIDKKQQFKINQSYLLYKNIIDQIRSDTQNSQVPQKLDLNFTFEQHGINNQNTSSQLQQLSEVDLNCRLLDWLQQISEKGNLQRNELRGLQILSEVGMFRSKRSPVLLMRKEYEGWKQHYHDSDPS